MLAHRIENFVIHHCSQSEKDLQAYANTKTNFFLKGSYGAFVSIKQVSLLMLIQPLGSAVENLCLVIANVAGKIFSKNYSISHAWMNLCELPTHVFQACILLPAWCITCPVLMFVRFVNPHFVLDVSKPRPNNIDVRRNDGTTTVVSVQPESERDNITDLINRGLDTQDQDEFPVTLSAYQTPARSTQPQSGSPTPGKSSQQSTTQPSASTLQPSIAEQPPTTTKLLPPNTKANSQPVAEHSATTLPSPITPPPVSTTPFSPSGGENI